MFTEYVTRGAKAGVVGGIAFGLFIALVGNPLIGYAETFEHSHGGEPAVSGTVTAVVSVMGGVLLGVLLGAVVFGTVYYFLEPVLPGGGAVDAESYLLGGAGFITVSGAPWVVFPPQPPGVEQSLPVDARVAWYALMMGVGALACGLAGCVYRRFRRRFGEWGWVVATLGAIASLGVIPLVGVVAPANTVAGHIPSELVSVFQAVTVMGQVVFWFVLATAHAWLVRDEGTVSDSESDPIDASSVAVDP